MISTPMGGWQAKTIGPHLFTADPGYPIWAARWTFAGGSDDDETRRRWPPAAGNPAGSAAVAAHPADQHPAGDPAGPDRPRPRRARRAHTRHRPGPGCDRGGGRAGPQRRPDPRRARLAGGADLMTGPIPFVIPAKAGIQ